MELADHVEETHAYSKTLEIFFFHSTNFSRVLWNSQIPLFGLYNPNQFCMILDYIIWNLSKPKKYIIIDMKVLPSYIPHNTCTTFLDIIWMVSNDHDIKIHPKWKLRMKSEEEIFFGTKEWRRDLKWKVFMVMRYGFLMNQTRQFKKFICVVEHINCWCNVDHINFLYLIDSNYIIWIVSNPPKYRFLHNLDIFWAIYSKQLLGSFVII